MVLLKKIGMGWVMMAVMMVIMLLMMLMVFDDGGYGAGSAVVGDDVVMVVVVMIMLMLVVVTGGVDGCPVDEDGDSEWQCQSAGDGCDSGRKPQPAYHMCNQDIGFTRRLSDTPVSPN